MRDRSTPDYYRILDVPPSATEATIKAQYRLLSKRLHPDMGGSQTAMSALNEAYVTLSDRFRRSIYDAERRRALHVPPRTPEQPVSTPPRRQPAPRAQAPFTAEPFPAKKHRASWWARLAWGFAALVIIGGLLMYLPLAEAGSGTTAQPTSQPQISYQPDTSTAQPNSTFYTAPDGTSYTAPSASASQTDGADQPKNTCSSATDDTNCYTAPTNCTEDDPTCEQSAAGPDKRCVTKTFGPYTHTTCSAAGGTNSCTTNTVGKHRYTTCY